MRRKLGRPVTLIAFAAIALVAPTLHATAAPGPPTVICAPVPHVSDKCPVWGDVYDNTAGYQTNQGEDWVEGISLSPDGTRLYAYGHSMDDASHSSDLVVISYDAASGAQRWLYRYNAPEDGTEYATGLAVSADGSTVYVAGGEQEEAARSLVVIALDTATASQRWVTTYSDPNGDDVSSAGLALSSDGARLYVGGTVKQLDIPHHAIALSVSTDSGGIDWISGYSAPDPLVVQVLAMAASPRGGFYLTGFERPSTTQSSTTVLTVAFADDRVDHTGAVRWANTYDGGELIDKAFAIAVAPDGSKVAVAGYSEDPATHNFLDVTIGYDDSGRQLWVDRYTAPGGPVVDFNQIHAAAFAPDGSRVYVTGESDFGVRANGKSVGPKDEMSTIAIDAQTGAEVWSAQFAEGTLFDIGYAIAVSPDGNTVFVAGDSGPGAVRTGLTLGYDADLGTLDWTSRILTGPNDLDSARSIAVSPDGHHVYVGGEREHLVEGTVAQTQRSDGNISDIFTCGYSL